MNMEAAGKTKLQKTYFDVLGLCCPSEIPLIENVLKQLDGIKDYSILVPTKTLIVFHDSLLVSQIQIVKALNQARLEANVRVNGKANFKNKWPSPYSIASGVLLLLSFLKYFYGPLQWLAVASVAVGIPPIVLKGVAALRNFTLDINILVLITVGGSLALQDYWEAGTIVFLFSISDWLESRASHKASAVMSSLVNVVPQRAVLAETGEEIDADEVKLNTILAVKAGEVIPIDGIVVEGSCEVDEKILTGESFPVPKQKDSIVWASTINLNGNNIVGYINVKTIALAEDCVVARMTKIVEEAQSNKSPTQRFIDKFAKYYTPAIVVISGLIAIVPLAFHLHNKRKWYHLALVVLVSGCPCAILLSTPVAIFCALSKAATLGVLFKGAEHLENLAKIKIMAFDKTGTITRGEFQVVDFKSIDDDVSFNKLLYWVSSIESKSSHPMAEALVDYARQYSIEPRTDKVENFENFPGEGIYGKIDDDEIYIGNRKIAVKAGCYKVPNLEGNGMEGKSIGYVFVCSSLIGIFSLSDMCRTGAKEAINDLKSMGIRTVMLTGDCQGAANRAQNQLDGALDLVRAELLPEGKAQEIKQLQRDGPTAMIGDGLNDAPALVTADIGISMGVSGSALAAESGDVILMSIDLQKIPKAHSLAKKAKRKIFENVAISFSTKVGILGLAIAGHPLVWAAVLVDVGTCLLVIFNSMLLLRGSKSLVGNQVKCRRLKNQCESTGLLSSSCVEETFSCSDIEAQEKCEAESCASKKCSSLNLGVGSSANDKKCCESSNSRAGSYADDKKCCNPSNSSVISCADDKKCCNPSNSRAGSHVDDKKCCKPSNSRADSCSDDKKCCKPSNSRFDSCSNDKKCCKPLNSRADSCSDDKKCCEPSNSRAGSCSDDKKCCEPSNSRAGSCSDDKKRCEPSNSRAGSCSDDKKRCEPLNSRAVSCSDDKKCCEPSNSRAGSCSDDKKCCKPLNSRAVSCSDDKKRCEPSNSRAGSCSDDKKCCKPSNSRAGSCSDDKKRSNPLNSISGSSRADDKKCSNANKLDSNCTNARGGVTSQGCCQENKSLNHDQVVIIEEEVITSSKNCKNKCCGNSSPRGEEPNKPCASSKMLDSSDSRAGCCSDNNKKCCSTNKKDDQVSSCSPCNENKENAQEIVTGAKNCCGNSSRNKASTKANGGCCESYRRECCRRNDGSSISGDLTRLSEIVIEHL